MFKGYVISLNEPNELINHLESYGILARWIEAVNGSRINNKIIKKNTTTLYSMFGTKNSIAIAMSHMKAWRTFLATEQPYTIIFEDDAIVEKDFCDKLTINLKYVPKDFDLLYLGCFGCQNSTNTLSVIFSLLSKGNRDCKIINEYINKPYIALALHGYMISRKGAIKLLKMLEGKIYYYLDYILQDLHSKNLINVYSLNERIVYQSSTDSDVSSTAINTHPLLLNKTLSKFYIDKKCRASYLTTVSIFRIGEFNFTISSILFIVLGIVLAYVFTNKDDSLDVVQATILFIIISLPDINEENEKKDLIIKIHFLLFIIPFFIMKNILNYNNNIQLINLNEEELENK
jgi:GR25 family glycosyltransferase involved in LPS biosynthesis